jgi:hypothetical protein
MSVTSDNEKKEIYIEDIGVTFRTLLAVAAKGYAATQTRRWHVVYRGARIGLVQVKNEDNRTRLARKNLKGNQNARHANSTDESVESKPSKAKAVKRANLALVAGPPPQFSKNFSGNAERKTWDDSVQSDQHEKSGDGV